MNFGDAIAVLHFPTLSIATALATVLLAILLLVAWFQGRSHRALLWWAASYAIGASALPLIALRDQLSDVAALGFGNGFAIAAAACAWQAARSFEGRSVSIRWVALALLAWMALFAVPAIGAVTSVRISTVSLLMAGFIFAGAWELWRGRNERLVSRWPAIVTMTIYGIALLCRVPSIIFVEAPPAALTADRPISIAIIALISLLYVVLMSCNILAMTKERMEQAYRHIARTDSLTQLLTRSAFFEECEAHLKSAKPPVSQVAMVAIDLDSFKRINDRFGHLIGDAVLVAFANVLRQNIGPHHIAGRLGGEEFAILLPGQDEVTAMILAESVRASFEQSAMMIGGKAVNPTLSAGVCVRRDASLTELLADADHALYVAKEAGRNRVRLAPQIRLDPPPSPPEAKAA